MRKAALRLLASTLLFMGAALVTPSPSRAAVTGNVQGFVRGEQGESLQSAVVHLEGAGAPVPTKTDKTGFYAFNGVQPGVYTLRVEIVTYAATAAQVTVSPDVTANADFALNKTEITGPGKRVTIAPTRRHDTSSLTVINAVTEQRLKAQPNNIFEMTGLLNYQPGVTADSGQYPHVRGSDGNQIQWMVDGINIRDPITNQFATNLVTVGVRSSTLVTGGPTADYNGATGGFLNQVTVNGRDIAPGRPFGGFIENINGPASKWQYYNGNTQIGGVLFDNKFDYALSSINFKTRYGDNTQLGELHSSHDESAKFNFFPNTKDTVTAYFSHGQENYNFFQTAPNSLFFDPDKVLTDPATGRKYYSARDLGSDFNDHNVQTYNLDHLTLKHNFTPASYLQYRLYQLHFASPGHAEATGNFFLFDRTNTTGNRLDYVNQISRRNTVRAGIEYLDSKGSYRRQVSNVGLGPLDANSGVTSYSDRIYGAYPKDTTIYLGDQLRTADNKVTLDLGLVFNSTTFNLQPSKYAASKGIDVPGAYTTKSTDPRVGLNYSPRPDLTFRSSYAVTSQRPDMRRVQRVAPFDVGAIGTSLSSDELAQSRSAFNAQGFSRLALSHAKEYDLGVEKAFTLGGLGDGQYSVGLTGYKRRLYDVTYLNPPDYTGTTAPSPAKYDNEGTGHASGFELTLRKLPRTGHESDWSGFVNYTNQVVRANSNFYYTNYTPYFQSVFGGNPFFGDSAADPTVTPDRDLRRLNRQEFATAWDQRHTVAVAATKRFTRLLESTFILDAGSGLPFYAGSTIDGNFRATGGQFGELGNVLGGAADFGEVPVVLSDNRTLPPINPVVGYTGWHYKFSINNNFYLTRDFSLFLNVDNVFDRKTALTLATGTFAGEPYFNAPSAQYPQGQQVYRYQSKLTPLFLTFGFRQRF